ncbi:septum site-determining protein MinC [Chelatococcus sp. GCM10030263]|uniref:septum site-determining protein MinC n=1 Tax=Chelatococcus sp. GCM10030263 TaxID=3273387 RepID=UPI003623D2DB
MTVAVRTRSSLRFRGRSFLALVLAPEPPLADWMAELDNLVGRSQGFFAGRAVILDVSALNLDKAGLTTLLSDLSTRGIRIMAIEGTEPASLGLGMPPAVNGGRDTDLAELLSSAERQKAGLKTEPRTAAPGSLMLENPVRSGQSIIFPQGDVTVLGSVASGAEVIAGGSIHIYGALRGRALAGSAGNAKARIFCQKLEAELLAIDGLYRTADDMDSQYRGRPAQIWLEGDVIRMAALG